MFKYFLQQSLRNLIFRFNELIPRIFSVYSIEFSFLNVDIWENEWLSFTGTGSQNRSFCYYMSMRSSKPAIARVNVPGQWGAREGRLVCCVQFSLSSVGPSSSPTSSHGPTARDWVCSGARRARTREHSTSPGQSAGSILSFEFYQNSQHILLPFL